MRHLRETQMWNGTSPEGIEFEIRFWGKGSMNEGAGMWNYYIYLLEQQLRPEDWERVWLPVARVYEWGGGTPTYDEYHSVLSEGDFHGGITFYEKRAAVDRDQRSVKVGCDYGHLWDREGGYGYRLEDIQRDALGTCQKACCAPEPARPLHLEWPVFRSPLRHGQGRSGMEGWLSLPCRPRQQVNVGEDRSRQAQGRLMERALNAWVNWAGDGRGLANVALVVAVGFLVGVVFGT